MYCDNIYDSVPILTVNEVQQQLEEHIKFLELVHPFLKEKGYHKECVELRPIRRSGKGYIRSFNLWSNDNKCRVKLKEFLQRINGEPLCLYYSVFNLDYNKKTIKTNGKSYQKGYLNEQNALYTTTLVMDFDKIEYSDYKAYKSILNNIGLETITVFTGHGFQNLILLSEKVHDKNILKKFTKLLLMKGFDVDPAIVECARVMRMPYSFNCKELDNKNSYYKKEQSKVIKTAVLEITTKRYTLKEVFQKIESLPHKPNILKLKIIKFDELKGQEDHEPTNQVTLNQSNHKNTSKEVSKGDKLQIKDIKEVYKGIDFSNLPPAIQKMLSHTKEGYRNKVLLFLIPFFRNTLKLDIKLIKEIMIIWGEHCDPQLNKEFILKEVDRICAYGFKGKFGKYDEEMAKEFGWIEFSKYRLDNNIIITNKFFEVFYIIPDTAVKIYLMMKTYEKIDKIDEWQKKDILKVAKISNKTFYNNIDILIKLGFIDKKRSNKKVGEPYRYYLNRFFNKSKGFTTFPIATLENMISQEKKLSNGEMKLYAYMCYMIGSNSNECYASQSYLGQMINKRRNSICEMTTQLHKKRYIRKNVVEDGIISHCTYTLLY